eukprot:781085-Prorocentrum_minimum.AAC.2
MLVISAFAPEASQCVPLTCTLKLEKADLGAWQGPGSESVGQHPRRTPRSGGPHPHMVSLKRNAAGSAVWLYV